MCHKTKRFRLVEVDCKAQASVSLDKEEVLRDAKRITAIQAYKVANKSLAPSGRPTVNDTVFAKAQLVIKTPGDDEVQYKIPFCDMDKQGNGGILYEVDIPPIAPTKCEIVIPSTTGVVTTESYVLGFHYEK